jgi:hypothetical protein
MKITREIAGLSGNLGTQVKYGYTSFITSILHGIENNN